MSTKKTLVASTSFDQDLQSYIEAYSKREMESDHDYMDESEETTMFLPTRQIAEEQLKDVQKTLYRTKILPKKIRCIICWSSVWTAQRGVILLIIVSAFLLASWGTVYWANKYQTELRHGLTRGDCIESTCVLVNPLKCCCNVTFIPLDPKKNTTEVGYCSTDAQICGEPRHGNATPYKDRCWINPNFEIWWKNLPPRMWILQTFIILSLALASALSFGLSFCCTRPVPNKLLSDYYAAQDTMQQNHDLYAYVPLADI